jgi:hypothetical protein
VVDVDDLRIVNVSADRGVARTARRLDEDRVRGATGKRPLK